MYNNHPHPYYSGNGPHSSQPQRRRRTSSKPRKERPDVDKIVEGVISQLKIKGLFDQFRKDCLSDVDTKPSYINLQSKVAGTVDTFLKGQTWSPSFPKLKMRDVMRKKIEEAPYFVKGLDSIVDQALGCKLDSIFKPIIEAEVFSYMGCTKEEHEEKKRLKLQLAEEQNQRPPSPPSPPKDQGGEHRHFGMLGSEFYNMPPSGYPNLIGEQSIKKFSPPPLPPMEAPPPPPEEEEEFDEQMDYTPVTPPYPPPADEPLPPGEEEEMEYSSTQVNYNNNNKNKSLQNGVKKEEKHAASEVEHPTDEIHKSENEKPPGVFTNGWAPEPDLDDNMESNMSATSECVDEEEDSEEESPMFEKIGEVSPPRPVLLENSDDILRELQEQARKYSGGDILGDKPGTIHMSSSIKKLIDSFDNNSGSGDSGSSNLVICEDTPPQDISSKTEEKKGRKPDHSDNSNGSSTSSRQNRNRDESYKRSNSSSSKHKNESTSKESKSSSRESRDDSRPHSRSSRSSSGPRSRDRKGSNGNSSHSSRERDHDKDKRRDKKESTHGSGSQKHSSSSSSHNRSSSSHSSHNKHSSSSSRSNRHSSSSHRHSSSSRTGSSSSAAKPTDRSLSSTRSEKKDRPVSISSSICGDNSDSSKDLSNSPDPNMFTKFPESPDLINSPFKPPPELLRVFGGSSGTHSDYSSDLSPKLSDPGSDPPSPFKLPEQLRTFASSGLSKLVERDRTSIQASSTFSATVEDSKPVDQPKSNKVSRWAPVESLKNVEEKGCDNEISDKPSSALEKETTEDVDENCKYLEPIPVFEEKLSYYRKLPEYQLQS